MPVEAEPVTAVEFAAAFAACGPFEPHPVIAIAVSGGADSMALLHLLADWAQPNQATLIAFTVDHRLRPEAAAEAAQVAAWAAKLGIEHQTLVWEHEADVHGQDRARQARYELLGEACAVRGILHLAVAHHQNDQAETFLLRLARGSGLDGLTGMRPVNQLAQVRLLRPLLRFPGERLRATCRARQQDWCEDPSNASLAYARPRLRVFQEALAAEGFNSASLASTMERLSAAAEIVQHATTALLVATVTIHPQACAELLLAPWQAALPELRRRSLGQIIRTIGNEPYLPQHEQLTALLGQMAQPDFTRATLGNCLLIRQGEMLLIERENRHLAAGIEVQPGWQRWDRFMIFTEQPAYVRAVEPADLVLLPVPARPSLALTQPAVMRDGIVVAMPTLGYQTGTETIECRFAPRRPLINSAVAASLPVV